MVGFQAEVNKWRQLQASKLDLISESVPNINAATGESTIDKSKLTHWATAGFFGRLNYDYKERYLLEVNLRYDGTSRFAKINAGTCSLPFLPDGMWHVRHSWNLPAISSIL